VSHFVNLHDLLQSLVIEPGTAADPVKRMFSALFQARARIENDAMYRALAGKAVAAQSENQAALSAIRADLSKAVASLAAVEKILEQVD